MNVFPARGYIALVSVLIISAILLALTFETSTEAYFARFTTTDMDTAIEGKELSNSCGSLALLYLAEDNSYRPPAAGVTISIDDIDSCVIDTIQFNNSIYTINTHVYLNGVWSITTITASMNATSSSLSVDTWK